MKYPLAQVAEHAEPVPGPCRSPHSASGDDGEQEKSLKATKTHIISPLSKKKPWWNGSRPMKSSVWKQLEAYKDTTKKELARDLRHMSAHLSQAWQGDTATSTQWESHATINLGEKIHNMNRPDGGPATWRVWFDNSDKTSITEAFLRYQLQHKPSLCHQNNAHI